MSPTEPTRPKFSLLPSPQEDVHAYMAAIRLDFSNRKIENARVDREKRAAYADSYGRHHPFPLSTDATTPGGPEPIPVLNQTSPSILHPLATRNSIVCEAHLLGFKEHIACGRYDGWFVLAFFLLFCTIGLSWIKYRKPPTRQLDEEDNGNATWPRSPKVCTNCSIAKLKNKIRIVHRENRGSEEEVGARQYEPVGWRGGSNRAVRANVGGKVEHDGGPATELLSFKEMMEEGKLEHDGGPVTVLPSF